MERRIVKKILGKGTPVNEDSVSVHDTVIGLGIAANALLNRYK